jgi:hypothetical protein
MNIQIKALNIAANRDDLKLRFADSHSREDVNGPSKNRIDIMCYSEEDIDGNHECCREIFKFSLCWKHGQLGVEAKIDADPFTSQGQQAINNLQQVIHYILDFVDYRSRTCLFVVLVFKNQSARLLRWCPDRIDYSKLIEFFDEQGQIAEGLKLFCHFVRSFAMASPAQRGIDTTIQKCPSDLAEKASACFKNHRPRILKAKFEIPPLSEFFLVDVPAHSPNEPLPEEGTPDWGNVRQFVAARLSNFRYPLFERNAKFFLAWDPNSPDKLYFLKDSWAYLGNGRHPEIFFYRLLKEKNVTCVQTVVCGGYVSGNPYYKTETGNVGDPSKFMASDTKKSSQRLHRLVAEFACPLSSASNLYELLNGWCGGVEGRSYIL